MWTPIQMRPNICSMPDHRIPVSFSRTCLADGSRFSIEATASSRCHRKAFPVTRRSVRVKGKPWILFFIFKESSKWKMTNGHWPDLKPAEARLTGEQELQHVHIRISCVHNFPESNSRRVCRRNFSSVEKKLGKISLKFWGLAAKNRNSFFAQKNVWFGILVNNCFYCPALYSSSVCTPSSVVCAECAFELFLSKRKLKEILLSY